MSAVPEVLEVKPQPAQERFLRSSADIVVYGGAAGAGKSYALLLEPQYHIDNPNFGAVIFRRTYPQIMNEGGLWDDANDLYPQLGAASKLTSLEFVFPSGARVRFAHMQHESDRHDWDGSQIALIEFDQLEHFTRKQFFYMLSRNRSMCGVRPYIRATCNPNPDHWLRDFMRWWIDDDTGLPIEKHGGVVRYFRQVDGDVEWLSTKAGKKAHKAGAAKSFTFIPGKVTDNLILLKEDPSYLANLKALQLVDRERLLHGNWNARETAGSFYRRDWFELVKATPAGGRKVRYWDRGAPSGSPDQLRSGTAKGSHTAGAKISKVNGVYYIEDMCRFQGTPGDNETAIKNTATQDGPGVEVGIEQDPGQAGKAEAQLQVRNLAGFIAYTNAVREAKGTRAKAMSAQAEHGNVKICGLNPDGSIKPWVEPLLRELENFDGSDKCASDQADACSGGFMRLAAEKRAGVWGR